MLLGYPVELTEPIRAEVAQMGLEELKTPQNVEEKLSGEGTVLVFINSVCGCSAGNARPGLKDSLNSEKKPNALTTVFAGVDREATSKVREYIDEYAPSSPAIAIFKDRKVVFMLERTDIEGHNPQEISSRLKKAYEEFC